jgi:TDG/mug DNA glycosylase family protein
VRKPANRLTLPTLRDRIRPGVEVLFVGINPGVRSALTGHHFAGFSNRFWKLLYESGLVPEPITFVDDDRLPDWGFGITNIVPRATPGIDTLSPDEYVRGRTRLHAKIRKFRPRVIALVGVTVFRAMFPEHRGRVVVGLQTQTFEGAPVFVLPNTSGRNANFSYAEMLAAFKSLKRFARHEPQRHRDSEEI